MFYILFPFNLCVSYTESFHLNMYDTEGNFNYKPQYIALVKNDIVWPYVKQETDWMQYIIPVCVYETFIFRIKCCKPSCLFR